MADSFARMPFDLQNGIPFRALLITNKHNKHMLVMVTHHIAVDGSLPILLRDLSRLYEQRMPVSEVSPADYFAYCKSQHYLQPFEQLTYWQRLLTDFPKSLDLPKDVTVTQSTAGAGRLMTITLPTELSASLQQFSQERGVTLFHSLLAITWIYLARVCQVDDLAVTVPIDTRILDDFQNSVGNFINTVILRGQLGDQHSFEDILNLARVRTMEAIQHSQLPYEVILERVVRHRNKQGLPVLNTMISLVNSNEDFSLGPTTCVPITLELQTTRFDLGFFFKQHRHGIDLQLEYTTDGFSDARAKQFAEQWQIVSKALLSDPTTPWREAPLLSPAQIKQVIHDWNATYRPISDQALIHDAFLEQVNVNPSHIAIRTASTEITYQELHERVNQIATTLLETDLPPQSRVAVLMERSPDVIASILAIVIVGMVYVPFDPANPVERFQKMVEVADIKGIVTDDRFNLTGQHLLAQTPLTYQIIVNDSSLPETFTEIRSPNDIRATDLAYIIFTSGTTGTPKGVAVQHSKAVNLIDWVNHSFNVGSQDVLLFITSVAFDLSVYDIFGVLSAGGTIRLASLLECKDPSQLVHILTHEGITFWDSAPIAFEQCLPYITKNSHNTLRLVFLSGDWIPVNMPERISACFTKATLIALGGATEATIWSNYHRIEPIDSTRRSIPYGKPIQNARYYILDSNLQPVPVGFAGVLYIAGDVLAQSYYRDSKLTAEKFVSDPFVSKEGARMYQTGDRARYFTDGTIEFLGREDNQVKIHGYRVETGEIEAAFLSMPEVQGAHVRIMGEKSARWLCAYLVYCAGQKISELTLRHRLRDRIPEYMLPTKLIELESLPITSNGKLDTRALPDPEVQSTTLKQVKSNSLEEQLLNLWRRLLQRDTIGRHENFFDLGGNSKLLIQLHQELNNEFGFTLPIVKLFQYTTVATLQEYLTSLNKVRPKTHSHTVPDHKVRPNQLLLQKRLRNKTKKDN